MHKFNIRPLLLILIGLTVFVAACGTDSSSETAEATETSSDQDTGTKPVIEVPDGDPPVELLIEDLVVGDGDEAVAGAIIDVDYVGVSWSNGQEFDASWERGAPFSFPLAAGQVIAGWDEGVQGMRVGGRRQITIPPEMAYGSAGAGGLIGPDETLIFVVDLRAVN